MDMMAPTTTMDPTMTTTAPQPPAWLGGRAKGMPEGFYNIRPNLFPFYQMRNQQDFPGYGIYTPGTPKLTSWQNPQGTSMVGIRNQGQNVFARPQDASPFGQELLRRASMGGMFQFPYEGGMQPYGYIPPDVTRQQYNKVMRQQARNARAAGTPMVVYYNPGLLSP